MQKGFQERAEGLGYNIDITSSGTIMKSLESIHDPIIKKILELLSRKATVKAKYFCAGMLDIAKYQHYALSVPLYTHFTSPIRRYADVLVHRQLDSILQAGGEREWTFTILTVCQLIFYLAEPKFALDRDAVAKVAQQCNMYVGALSGFDTPTNPSLQTARRNALDSRRSSRPICISACSFPT